MHNATPLGVAIAVGNQKGGVGKSTTTVHLAAALGKRGYRCLIIDLDPAAGSTRHLGVPELSFAGTLELLTSEERVQSLVLSDGLPENVHLVPSRPQLSELETMLSKFVDRTMVLDRAVREARTCYDFVLLDTPPSAGAVTTVAAYSVSEWFLLTTFPHPLSMAGLSEACRDIADVRVRRNPELEVLGVLFTNVDARTSRLRGELDAVVHELLPGRRFRTSISQAVVIPQLSGEGRTVFQHPRAMRLPPTLQFIRLAQEVEHRVLHREQFLRATLGDPEWELPGITLTTADRLVATNRTRD